jgi:hypothetical protein
MHERGHSEVPSFTCQATSMSSCPCFLPFWPIFLHSPIFHSTCPNENRPPVNGTSTPTRPKPGPGGRNIFDLLFPRCPPLRFPLSLPSHTHAHTTQTHAHARTNKYIYIFTHVCYIYMCVCTCIHTCMSLAVLCACTFQLPSSTWNVSFQNPQDTAPLPMLCHNRHAARCTKNTINVHLYYFGRRFGASPNPLWHP